jgi:FixJ family two-component response regulator
MIATSHIENRAVGRVRMSLSKQPYSEVVCVVDDDLMVLKSTGRLLASDGFAVRPFSKGADFIAYVQSHDVPLVVLDLWMKEMTGLEVLARLCAVSPQTHVIVITGHEDSAAQITAMQIGAVAFFIKPFDDEQFLEMVHRALGHPPDTKRLIKPGTRDRLNRTRGWAFVRPLMGPRSDGKSQRNLPKFPGQEKLKGTTL